MTTSTKPPKFAFYTATFLGSGLSPYAPGTVGSVAALPLAYGLLFTSTWVALIVLLILFFVGVWASNAVEKALDSHDAGLIVIDEVVGQCLVVILLDQCLSGRIDMIPLLVLGFLGFRFFDIVKPWPVSWADKKVQGGLGVMLDDVVAALLAVPVLVGAYLLFTLVAVR